MVSATLVSSLVTRAEELSSPYVSAARQRSPLVDRTASKVAELAKQYEVESYVKKADELADKAATEALARLPERTKSQLTAALAKSRAEHLQLLEAYATGKVDSLAASVVTLVDRLLPEEEGAAFPAAAGVAQVKALPRVVYRRGHAAAERAAARGAARGRAARARAVEKRAELELLALARKELLLQHARHARTTALELVDELRDEFDQRTLPLRDAAAVRKAELQLRCKALLAEASAKRALYTELAWAQLRERNLDVYVLDAQRRVAVVRAAALVRAHEWRIVAAERSGHARTLFVQQKERVIAVTVNAKQRATVRVVAVREQLTQQWRAVQERAGATAQEARNTAAAQRALAAAAEARAALAAKAAEAVDFAKERSAPARARAVEVAQPLIESAEEKLALAKEKACAAVQATPAAAGAVAAKLLGEERGVQAEKQAERLVHALPVVSSMAA